MDKEIWKKIDGYENYSVSKDGDVRNDKTERILKPHHNKAGYQSINLYKNGKVKHFQVHRLVAETFIPNPDDLPCIDHINTIRDDNRVENLRWVTYKENMNNPLTRKKMSGENHPMYERTGENNPTSKMVICVTTREIFNGAMEAERQTGVNQSNISLCCSGKRKSAGVINGKPAIWMYYDEYLNLTEEEIEKIKNQEVPNEGRPKAIICLTTGEVYESVHEVSRETGVNLGNICACCRGKLKSAGKHPETGEKLVWMYYEDYLLKVGDRK